MFRHRKRMMPLPDEAPFTIRPLQKTARSFLFLLCVNIFQLSTYALHKSVPGGKRTVQLLFLPSCAELLSFGMV